MRVGVDGDHVVDGDEMGAAVALDRKVAGEAPRRAGAAERPIAAAAEFGIGVVAVAAARLATEAAATVSGWLRRWSQSSRC